MLKIMAVKLHCIFKDTLRFGLRTGLFSAKKMEHG